MTSKHNLDRSCFFRLDIFQQHVASLFCSLVYGLLKARSLLRTHTNRLWTPSKFAILVGCHNKKGRAGLFGGQKAYFRSSLSVESECVSVFSSSKTDPGGLTELYERASLTFSIAEVCLVVFCVLQSTRNSFEDARTIFFVRPIGFRLFGQRSQIGLSFFYRENKKTATANADFQLWLAST